MPIKPENRDRYRGEQSRDRRGLHTRLVDIVLEELEASIDAELFQGIRLDELLAGDDQASAGSNGAKMEVLHEQAVQLEPPNEYVLIVAGDDAEWERLKEYFQLQHVRRGGYHEDSPFDDIGLQRVVRASDFLKRIDDDRGDSEQGAVEQNA